MNLQLRQVLPLMHVHEAAAMNITPIAFLTRGLARNIPDKIYIPRRTHFQPLFLAARYSSGVAGCERGGEGDVFSEGRGVTAEGESSG